jgi:hypothetical protein
VVTRTAVRHTCGAGERYVRRGSPSTIPCGSP